MFRKDIQLYNWIAYRIVWKISILAAVVLKQIPGFFPVCSEAVTELKTKQAAWGLVKLEGYILWLSKTK